MTKDYKLGLLVGVPIGIALYFLVVWLLQAVGDFEIMLDL